MDEKLHSGGHFAKVAGNSSLFFIVSALTKASGLILLPIMTRLLAPDEIGLLANLDAIVRFSTVFISLYIDNAYLRFYFENNDSHARLRLYTSSFFWFILSWGLLMTGAYICVGFFFISNFYKIAFFPLVLMAALSPLLTQLRLLGLYHLRSEMKTAWIVLPNFLIFLLGTGLSLFLMIQFDLGVVGRFAGVFFLYFLSCGYYVGILFKDRLVAREFDWSVIREGLVFSLPLAPMVVASWITRLSDRLILTCYEGTMETGYYDVAYRLGEGVRLFSESMFQVYSPIIVSMYTHDKRLFNQKMGRFATFFLWVVLIAAFYMAILRKEIFSIFTAPAYHAASSLLPIIAFGYCIGAQAKYLESVFSLRKVTYLCAVGYVGQALINLVLNFMWIPGFGETGAAWATFASLCVLPLWCGFWFIKWENVEFEWWKLAAAPLAGGVAGGMLYCVMSLIEIDGVLWGLFVKTLVTAPVVGGFAIGYKVVDFRQIKQLFRMNRRSFG